MYCTVLYLYRQYSMLSKPFPIKNSFHLDYDTLGLVHLRQFMAFIDAAEVRILCYCGRSSYLDACPKNDVISFSRKGFCALA